MAKIIQLAKDLLKGGSKEDIYPKTIDTAVYLTDDNNNSTGFTLKGFLTDGLNDTLGQYMPMDLFSPMGIIVTPSTTTLGVSDPTFEQLLDSARTSSSRRSMFVTYMDYNGTKAYILPLVEYTSSTNERSLIYSTFDDSNNRFIKVIINSDGSINISFTNQTLDVYISNTGSIVNSLITTSDIINTHFLLNGNIRLKMNSNGKDYHFILEESYELNGVKYMVFGCFALNNNTLRHIQASLSEDDTAFTITSTALTA